MVQKIKGVILLVALIAHHTPTLTSGNVTSDFLQKNSCYSENSQSPDIADRLFSQSATVNSRSDP
jgi:hypothetical protein